jgi:dTDP-4-amino-4,6-dideoxygalactose transaminase
VFLIKIEEVRTIADRYSIPILEDSAEALGSHHRACGTFGDSTLSLTVVKLLQLRGAIITSSLALKKKAYFSKNKPEKRRRIISILKLAIIIE